MVPRSCGMIPARFRWFGPSRINMAARVPLFERHSTADRSYSQLVLAKHRLVTRNAFTTPNEGERADGPEPQTMLCTSQTIFVVIDSMTARLESARARSRRSTGDEARDNGATKHDDADGRRLGHCSRWLLGRCRVDNEPTQKRRPLRVHNAKNRTHRFDASLCVEPPNEVFGGLPVQQDLESRENSARIVPTRERSSARQWHGPIGN